MTDVAAAVPANETPGVNLSNRQKLEILLAILLALFLFALDQTVVGTALPIIVTDLNGNYAVHVGGHDLPADVDDQRPDLRQAVGPVRPAADLHLGASACSWSPRSCAASARRCGSSSCSAASRASAAARSSRSRWPSSPTCTRRPSAASTSGCSGRCSGCRRSSGPAIGGLITDTCRLALDLLRQHPARPDLALRHAGGSCRPIKRPEAGRNIDYLGAALFAAAIAPFLIGLTNKQTGDWTDPAVGGLILLGLALGAVFLLVESRAADPIVPLGLFRIRIVHDLGRGDVPRGVRVLRRDHLPAALVPGRRRRSARRESGLQHAAAARRR